MNSSNSVKKKVRCLSGKPISFRSFFFVGFASVFINPLHVALFKLRHKPCDTGVLRVWRKFTGTREGFGARGWTGSELPPVASCPSHEGTVRGKDGREKKAQG